MELRSYNVEKVFVECLVSEDTVNPQFDEEKISSRKNDIVSMLEQLEPAKEMSLMLHRKDEEVWTRSLQIIKMLLTLGEAIGYLKIVEDKVIKL